MFLKAYWLHSKGETTFQKLIFSAGSFSSSFDQGTKQNGHVSIIRCPYIGWFILQDLETPNGQDIFSSDFVHNVHGLFTFYGSDIIRQGGDRKIPQENYYQDESPHNSRRYFPPMKITPGTTSPTRKFGIALGGNCSSWELYGMGCVPVGLIGMGCVPVVLFWMGCAPVGLFGNLENQSLVPVVGMFR